MEKTKTNGLQYYFFVVGERPFCLWGNDVRENTISFLDKIEPTYFEYVANSNFQYIQQGSGEEKDSQHAAISVRTAYSQGLEALFSLIGATIQAPYCVPSWLDTYMRYELHRVVEKIHRNNPIISIFKADSISWSDISEFVFSDIIFASQEKEKAAKEGFANLWSKFAAQFLDADFTTEYNSIKHGMRIRSGSFKLAIGRQEKWGESAPPENMQLVGASNFGTSFFKNKKIGELKHHIYLERKRLNWNPENYICGLHMISMSIHNVRSKLRILNGVPPEKVKFLFPEDISDFEKPWERSREIGLLSMTFAHSVIKPELIDPFSKEDILSQYKSGKLGGVKFISECK
jgi:hypothetical protein